MQLTEEQAYLAMHYFLNKQFSLGWTELGGLWGSMSLLSDGSVVDAALESDWEEAVTVAISGKVDARLRFRDPEVPTLSQHKMIGAGLAIGAGLGAALGVVFDNIPIGVALGVSLGVLTGRALANRSA